jgi:hypothetical protein
MVEYVENEYLLKLDKYLDKIEDAVDKDKLPKAEKLRLKFKLETKDIRERVEKLNSDLGELVIRFADLAKTPVTLVSDNDCLKEKP